MAKTFTIIALSLAAAALLVAQDPPPQQPPAQQPGAVRAKISGATEGLPPRFAVPDFIAAGGDQATQTAARTIGQVLWDDLNFEREFYMIARDTYKTIPQPTSIDAVDVSRWKELGTDGLVVGSVRRDGANLVVQVRLIEVTSGRSVWGREYSGKADNPRFFAHTISDEIHQNQVT